MQCMCRMSPADISPIRPIRAMELPFVAAAHVIVKVAIAALNSRADWMRLTHVLNAVPEAAR